MTLASTTAELRMQNNIGNQAAGQPKARTVAPKPNVGSLAGGQAGTRAVAWSTTLAGPPRGSAGGSEAEVRETAPEATTPEPAQRTKGSGVAGPQTGTTVPR